MLVLTRKRGEKIVIDGNIVVTVTEIQGNKVRLGIEAPSEIPVKRSELLDQPQNPPPPSTDKSAAA